jgi:RHS repeat-associated protein
MMKHISQAAVLIAVLVIFPWLAFSQVATGIPPFSSISGGPDTINLANLNAHWSFPILAKAGRGLPFHYALQFDNSVWKVGDDGSGNSIWQPVNSTQGWARQTEVLSGYMTYDASVMYDPAISGNCTVYGQWVYHDPAGTAHPFEINGALMISTPSGCYAHTASSGTGHAMDSSGYTIAVTATPPSAIVYPRSGGSIVPPLQNQTGAAQITDANGNSITTSDGRALFDTTSASTPVLTLADTGGGVAFPTSFTYTAPGGSKTITVSYTGYNVQTNFGCSTILEYGPTFIPLLTSITYPDGSSYQITYEDTPGYPGNKTGRLASVTLPTGGSISYSYFGGCNNRGITADGATAGFTRTVNDGTNSYNWTYWISGTGQTYVVDPQNNETDITFSGNFETQSKIYQGRASGGTLLMATQKCYNNDPNCNPTSEVTAQITSVDAYSNVGSMTSRVYTSFNDNELPTETDQYDFTSTTWSNPVKKTIISYASLGNNIVDRPSSVTVTDGNNNTLAQTSYAYDETGLGSLAGTPQHVAVSGARGNVTTISQWVQGTTYLSKTFSYLDTGNVLDTYDINGARTHYFYDSNPAVSCGNSFPQAAGNMDLGVYTWTDWNCAGAVSSVTRDPNYQPTATAWNDPNFWRPTGVTDPLGNTVSTGYGGATITESNIVFNGGNSIVDSASTRDGLGRPHFSQRRQGATGTALNTFDSVETDYDSDGRPYLTTVGYVGGGTQSYCSSHGMPANCTPPGTRTTYDALGRPLLVTDAGGGTVQSVYVNNDVWVQQQPRNPEGTMPTRQYEYDGLGRLTSVCELVTVTGIGRGTCAQTNPQIGYWTKYSYDTTTINSVLYTRMTVTQNAQLNPDAPTTQQTRSFTYDGLGRMTSENNPESGTTTYVYDSRSGYSSPGDLVLKVDANGNNTPYYYDALHRITDMAEVTPNTPDTPNGVVCKRFRYDNSTGVTGSIPSGVSISNPLGHIVEAETDNCAWPVTAPITDEWFSYSARGELTDVYESTAHSGGYYDVKQSYWEDGAAKQLSNLPGLPSITYGGLDGEGRVTTVTASTGISPANSVSYNNTDPSTSNEPLGALLSVSVGTTTTGQYDSDSFTYDKNTGRLTNYTFNVNGQTDVGALTWNANGSLQKLHITDGITGTQDSQTCNYSHDDLGRIAGVDCGTAWNQTFAYDPFGNITKNGSVTYQPAYNPATNRVTNTGFTYDSNGDFTSDVFRNYSWDAEGNMTSVTNGAATVNLTYDALGRMVEQQRGSSYTQIVYGPDGGKLALMNGQTLSKAFVPLPGGATAVYNSSGLQYYRHSDHLGSSRLASTPSRGLSYSGAYAPFGEPYKEAGITTDHAFTGQNEDTITALADFTFREYGFTHSGRWISPDPAGLSAADPTDPQSWNRYAYVRNRPLQNVDPLGLDCIYFTDDGNGVESVDGNSNSSECADNGGTWWEAWSYLGSWLDQRYVGNDGANQYYYSITVTASIDPINLSLFVAYDSGTPIQQPPLSSAQCDALQKVLDREAQKGTHQAALAANLDLPGTEYLLSPFNSDAPGYQPLQTAYGSLDIDWFSTLKASTIPGSGHAFYAYGAEKVVSILKRKYSGEKVTNYVPYSKADETNAAWQASKPWVGYKELLPPGWMKANCSSNTPQ